MDNINLKIFVVISNLVAVLLALLFMTSCKKADDFYDDLQEIPQLAGGSYSYQSTYRVGDTIYFYGRFGSPESNLSIHIGDVAARLINRSLVDAVAPGQSDVQLDSKLQLVKVPVEEAMGLGPDRPVSITLNGQTVKGPSIYIRSSNSTPAFADTLRIRSTGFSFDNTDHFFIRSWNGSGRVFYFTYSTQQLNGWKDSVITNVFSAFSDDAGHFRITTIRAANVDRQERCLYFFADTENDLQPAGTYVQRFCKMELATGTLSTLNRQELPTDYTLVTDLDKAGPYEGQVATINIPAMTDLFVKENGDVFFCTADLINPGVLQGSFVDYIMYGYAAVGKVTADGMLTYLNGTLNDNFSPLLQKLPLTFSNPKPAFSTYGFTKVEFAIDPDKQWLYMLYNEVEFSSWESYAISVFDLGEQREVRYFAPEPATSGIPTVLDGPFEAVKFDPGGAWILQKGNPVFFLTSNNARNDRKDVVGVDFETLETTRYAPGLTFENNIFNRTALNYTPEGHIIFYDGQLLEITTTK